MSKQGALAATQSASVSAEKSIFVKFGAAENVDLVLNGRRLPRLPIIVGYIL